ncbi:hypothetical protein ElyMa_005929100 [Elysia marginata]|uniref:Uncharacterized protein n=1 Tax=Elysia marginata TaxID=1093978 RepID=A0AAV4G7A2_9GAST|nr:hypothetical protein ElyMa_005929100 [Elysia marginata]
MRSSFLDIDNNEIDWDVKKSNKQNKEAAGTYDSTVYHTLLTSPILPAMTCIGPQLKKYQKGHHNDNDEEVIVDVRRWFLG